MQQMFYNQLLYTRDMPTLINNDTVEELKEVADAWGGAGVVLGLLSDVCDPCVDCEVMWCPGFVVGDFGSGLVSVGPWFVGLDPVFPDVTTAVFVVIALTVAFDVIWLTVITEIVCFEEPRALEDTLEDVAK